MREMVMKNNSIGSCSRDWKLALALQIDLVDVIYFKEENTVGIEQGVTVHWN
jgi:hypothetical protein